jgi:photosystem II stability/assembly factor-like uncharacterized protein
MRASHALSAMASVWVLVAAFSPTFAQAPDPSSLPAHDIRLGLFGACLVSPSEGWVVGDLGRAYKTTDGGESWALQQVAGRRPFFSASCVDSRTAWVSSTEGKIFATTDGGATWQEQQTPVERNLFKVAFSTPKRGTAVGDFGIIVHTEDGGATWTEVGLPEDFKLPEIAEEQGVLPNDALLYGLSFVDADTGWLSGEWGTILKTVDGGATWKQQQSGTEVTLFGIGFSDSMNGVAVGIDSTIVRTEDGGVSWQPVPSPFDERAYYEVAVAGQIGWIAGNQGTILVSNDGGRVWKLVQTPKDIWSEWFRGVSLLGNRGLIVGGAGKIYSTNGTEAVLLNPGPRASHGEGKS